MSEQPSNRRFLRLTRSQRIQHAILFVSTGFLIVTGFMLYTDRWIIESFGAASETIFWWRSWIHRVAGVMVTVVCVYHLIYVVVTREGRSWFKDMLPWYTDFIDAYKNVTFMLGFRTERPKLGRFFYLEKLEYWSVYFGMFIVSTTGFMMWTENWWPKFYLDVAVAFHFGWATSSPFTTTPTSIR
jgi:cytochrome b subunit of formate dehydrogenase